MELQKTEMSDGYEIVIEYSKEDEGYEKLSTMSSPHPSKLNAMPMPLGPRGGQTEGRSQNIYDGAVISESKNLDYLHPIDNLHPDLTFKTPSRCHNIACWVVVIVAMLAVGIGAGIGIGYAIFLPGKSTNSTTTAAITPVVNCSTKGVLERNCSTGVCLDITLPPECCSFPFTLNGSLYNQCTSSLGLTGQLGCFISRRVWVNCADAYYISKYTRVNITYQNATSPNDLTVTTVLSVSNWIVIQQRRIDGSFLFNGSWSAYKTGFGTYYANFWMGLEKVYQLTNSGQYSLRFEFLLINGTWCSVEYDTFKVDNESSNYAIHVTGYSGDIEDIMESTLDAGHEVHNGMSFSTYDRDNDRLSTGNCAVLRQGGWWYNACFAVGINNNILNSINNFAVLLDANSPSIWNYLSQTRMMMKSV